MFGAAVDQSMCWMGADVVPVCGIVSGSAVGVDGCRAEGLGFVTSWPRVGLTVISRASLFSHRVLSSAKWLKVGDRSWRFSCLRVVSRLWGGVILLADARTVLSRVCCMRQVNGIYEAMREIGKCVLKLQFRS